MTAQKDAARPERPEWDKMINEITKIVVEVVLKSEWMKQHDRQVRQQAFDDASEKVADAFEELRHQARSEGDKD